MFWHMYPELTQMDKFKTGKMEVQTYPDPPQNYYHESPEWEWKEGLKETASPELGEEAVNLIVDSLVSLIKERLIATERQQVPP